MSAAPSSAWRPIYDAGETVEQFAARQRQAFAAFEPAWREGRVSLKLKGYYDQLVRDVGANAYAWWTEERWAEVFGVSVSTIKRVLAALTTAGLIRRERQFGSSSRTYLTSYDRAAVPVDDVRLGNTDNQNPNKLPRSMSQHDITTQGKGDDHAQAQDKNPEALPEMEQAYDYRHPDGSFFGTSSDPTIGSLLRRDHLKTHQLTVGAAGEPSPIVGVDPLTHQVLEREGVADFAVAPQLAHQAAGELQAVSRYLDTQRNIRDRPRLFAWLTTHGFGRQLLAGRHSRPTGDHQHPRPRPPVRALRCSNIPPMAPETTPSPAPPPAHREVWAKVLDQLHRDHAVSDLSLWLDATVLLDLTETAAVIGAANVFQRDELQQRYLTHLEGTLGAALGRSVSVTVVVDRAS